MRHRAAAATTRGSPSARRWRRWNGPWKGYWLSEAWFEQREARSGSAQRVVSPFALASRFSLLASRFSLLASHFRAHALLLPAYSSSGFAVGIASNVWLRHSSTN